MHSRYKYRIRFILVTLFALAFINVNAKDFTVVIDPGHGGKDMGAIGLTTFEKDINLGVALKLGDLLQKKMKNVKVVYTRSTDTYLTLQERANIANKANGDIFISIHTNSLPKKAKARNTIQGAATYTLGLHRSDENLEVAKRENSVIELEKDYSETYKGFDPNSTESYIIFEINQSQHLDQSISFASLVQKELSNGANRLDNGVRQAGFWVLAATSMPAVLIELDFICNPTQEQFLRSDNGQGKLASSIFDALQAYKTAADNKIAIASKVKDDKTYQSDDNDKSKKQVKNELLGKNDIVINSSSTKQVAENKSKSTKGKEVTKENANNSETNTSIYKYNITQTSSATSRNKDAKKTSNDNTNQKNNALLLKDRVPVSESGSNIIPQSSTNSDNIDELFVYKIQFLTSGKELSERSPEFKKLSPVDFYYEKGLYKYTYGETTNLQEAKNLLDIIKDKFKGAFIIKFSNGKRINN